MCPEVLSPAVGGLAIERATKLIARRIERTIAVGLTGDGIACHVREPRLPGQFLERGRYLSMPRVVDLDRPRDPLKVVTVGLIAGTAFVYYLRDLRQDEVESAR